MLWWAGPQGMLATVVMVVAADVAEEEEAAVTAAVGVVPRVRTAKALQRGGMGKSAACGFALSAILPARVAAADGATEETFAAVAVVVAADEEVVARVPW